MVFGTGCLLAGLAVLMLPETAGRPLPDTIAELDAGALDKRVDKKDAPAHAPREAGGLHTQQHARQGTANESATE